MIFVVTTSLAFIGKVLLKFRHACIRLTSIYRFLSTVLRTYPCMFRKGTIPYFIPFLEQMIYPIYKYVQNHVTVLYHFWRIIYYMFKDYRYPLVLHVEITMYTVLMNRVHISITYVTCATGYLWYMVCNASHWKDVSGYTPAYRHCAPYVYIYIVFTFHVTQWGNLSLHPCNLIDTQHQTVKRITLI